MVVERSETEGGTTAAEAEANTDPAAAARRQQYQTEIAAIREDLTLADLYEIVKEKAGTGDMIKKSGQKL